jgi:hypothetical protein
MSSSATSAADTEGSDKHPPSTPNTTATNITTNPNTTLQTPPSKKSRSAGDPSNGVPWDVDSPSPVRDHHDKHHHPHQHSPLDSPSAGLENPKVQLPSIFTTFEDKFRPEYRRASLPTLYSDGPTTTRRHAPYPSPQGAAAPATRPRPRRP